jgi:valyl-tRNA synthetase
MKGDASLWLPGADHAGIETQFVFEKKLKKDGKSRFDFDRQTLYQMIWDYVQENAGVAKNQMKKIGASADWDRFTFTLDPAVVDIVLNTFSLLHQKDMIYRDMRLVNYCTRCGTGYSELEVKHETKIDPMIYMKYGPFTIATVRPETKFRDTALAVNPTDPRYKDHIGKTYEIMGLLGPVKMTIIADEEVDPAFGTGIMKVTPAHDFHDFELGKKNNLPVTPIIDFAGKMDFSWFLSRPDFSSLPQKYQERATRYHGLHVSKVRAMMIEDLKQDGILDHIDEKYEHTLSTCYRCGSVLEPLPLPQFFLKVAPMTTKVLEAMEKGDVTIHGPGYDKILMHWLKNLKDWNISRQIVWGIQIPVWYSIKENPTMNISFITSQEAQTVIATSESSSEEAIPIKGQGDQQTKNSAIVSGDITTLLKTYSLDEIKSGIQSVKAPVDATFVVSKESPGEDYIQETDTFDTWFSSGQWPFVTLQANPHALKSKIVNRKSDYERFYPTQVMETAYDILVFWVMRMLMMGMEITGQVPFQHVYLHGLVRDEKGQKMSKSKGNVINPISVIEKYGADAMRMALVMSTTAGKDSNTGEDKIRGMRNFTNKIWNASRYIIMKREELSHPNPGSGDTDFLSHTQQVHQTISQQLDNLQIGLAAETIYQEFWHYFCDEAIEKSKTGEISLGALTQGLKTFLTLLHPFVPFVTEEIWGKLSEENLLINSPWK